MNICCNIDNICSMVIEGTIILSHITWIGALDMGVIGNNVRVFSWVLNVVLESWTSVTFWDLWKTLCLQMSFIIL